jgi:tetratricopeptide (TPR) repeat protein
MKRTAVVFIHGLGSDVTTWEGLANLLKSDQQLQGLFEYEFFEYSSRLVGNRLLTRVPTYRTVADKLRTRFQRYSATYDSIIFVTHSQGGLVLQTFLSRMLADGSGLNLASIKRIILIACPNGGSGIFLLPRRVVGMLLPHAQERRLRPLDEEISDVHRHVVHSVVQATTNSTTTCSIPIMSFAAEDDGIVLRSSSYGSFRLHGVLPGTHATVIRPTSHDSPGYLDLRNELLKALENGDKGIPSHPDPLRKSSLPTGQSSNAFPSSPAPIHARSTTAGSSSLLNNLPRQTVGRLVGRDAQTAELLLNLHSNSGDITLIEGAAGTGKTTLALHACHELMRLESARFDAIIWLSARTTMLQTEGHVPTTTSASDLSDLTATIAITLDRRDLVRLLPSQRAVGVTAALADMMSVIVLDNFETVADPMILPFLRDLPQSCSIVITSRRRIDVNHNIHLRPLDTKGTEELAHFELHRRQLHHQDAAVDRIVELSGGIPLAVNWLVGRMALGAPHLTLPPAGLDDDELLKYLFQEGVEQLSGSDGLLALLVLAHPPGTVPSIVWEWALVDLRIEHASIANSISSLRTLNLIEYDIVSDRYYVLPVIKRFLLESSAAPEIRETIVENQISHAYVRALTDYLDREAEVLWQVGYTLNDWDRDRTNTINSIQNMLPHGELQLAAALLQAFYPFAITFGHFNEFLELTDNLLRVVSTLDATNLANLRVRRASILFHSGLTDAAEDEFRSAEEVFATLDRANDRLVDLMFFVRGIIAVSRRSSSAEAILREAIEFGRRRGVTWARLGFQGWLALYFVDVGRLAEAETLLGSSLAECAEMGDHRTSVFLHVGLACLRLARGQYDEIIRSAQEVLTLASQFGEDHNWAHLHLEVARAYLHTGDRSEARRHAEIARELYIRVSVSSGIEDCDKLMEVLD